MSSPWTSSRNKKNAIEKCHPKQWTLPCTFMLLQIDFHEVMEKIYSGKEKICANYKLFPSVKSVTK